MSDVLEIGAAVFFMDNNHLVKGVINGYSVQLEQYDGPIHIPDRIRITYTVKHGLNLDTWSETERVYRTKKELLESL